MGIQPKVPLSRPPPAAIPGANGENVPSPSRWVGTHALDWLSLLVGAMLTAFGPFISVYLVGQGWSQAHLGVTLSIGTATSAILGIPTGALVDALPTKRAIATLGILGVGASALLLAAWPTHWPVTIAEILFAASAGVLGPVIEAISRTLVDPQQLGHRFGRNTRFAAIGGGLSAASLGFLGSVLSARAIFVAAALLTLPALAMLWRINASERTMVRHDGEPEAGVAKYPICRTLRDRRLASLGAAFFLFHLANAAMLPIAVGEVARNAGSDANSLMAAGILVSQFIRVLCAPRLGTEAERIGRRPLLLLGFCCLPARGLLLATIHDPFLLPAIQVLGGLGLAVIGVILPLAAADLARDNGRFNLCLGLLGTTAAMGATLSTTLAGVISEILGHASAHWFLAGVGLCALALVWRLVPETGQVSKQRDRSGSMT